MAADQRPVPGPGSGIPAGMPDRYKSTIYLEQSKQTPECSIGPAGRNFLRLTLLWLFLALSSTVLSQQSDTANNGPDTVLVQDTLGVQPLVDPEDSVITLRPRQGGKEALTAPVKYKASDSIRLVLDSGLVHMYKACQLGYEKITLEADYVRIIFDDKLLFAKGLPDSTGKMAGNPKFSEGGEEFRAREMQYNFDSKKGLIYQVITQEGDGFLHGELIKKLPNDIINIRHGKYTTCSLDHPHFEFRFSRSKVIPDNKIITGPAYLVISDVPTPLLVPFGLFPNKKGQRSGILIPTYGESANRGFFFENFGYYWGINEYLDLELRGDIYTRGSWAVKTKTNYNVRYKYRGSLGLRYAVNITGDQGSVDYSKNRDYAINWTHQQSEKARPNSRFSSSVNIVSSKFNQFNPTSASDYLSNTFQSSVAYQTNWAGKYFLTASLNHRQNVITHAFDLTLPELSFSVNRFYPLRNSERAGKARWYDNISVQYKMNTRNELRTLDTLLFAEGMWDRFNNGMKHSIPVSNSLKVLKYFNLTNTLNYDERWYPRRVEQRWNTDTLISGGDTTVGYLEKDTVNGFHAVRDFSFTSSLTTRVYGMLNFRKGPVNAIRHVLTPTLSFSYRPDFGRDSWGYFDEYVDGTGNLRRYSYYDGFIFGTAPDGRSGRLNFSLGNNLEMKVRSRKDTLTGSRKVVLIENFTLSTSYDLARDSLRWAPLSMSGRTTLFRSVFLTYSSRWDPYAVNSNGRNIDRYEWDANGRLLRFDNASWALSLSYRLNDKALQAKKESEKGTREELDDLNRELENFVDFNVPWNLSFSYQVNYGITADKLTRERDAEVTTHTLQLNGDVNITPKWKIAFGSNYDILQKKISYSSVDIYRDLHCWEMRFNWIPLGFRKSWNFTINVKSAMLQDLKLNRKKDFRDYY